MCNYNAIFFVLLQEGSIATGILPTRNTPLSSLLVGSKLSLGEQTLLFYDVPYIIQVCCFLNHSRLGLFQEAIKSNQNGRQSIDFRRSV